jgi:hypothetical protein
VDQARKHIKAAVDGSPFAMVSIMAVVKSWTNFPLKRVLLQVRSLKPQVS